jgi:hypothetical protein
MTTMIDPQKGPLSEDLPNAEPMLFQQTVPPRLVRRTHSPDVFVTDLRVTGFNTFQVGVRWPAAHSFYGPTTQHAHDPLMFLEGVRQAGLLIAHVAFEIPTEFKFITHDKQFAISPDGLRTSGTEPVDTVITVTAHDIRRRGRGFAGMRFEFSCTRDGEQIGTAAYRWSCVSSAGYTRLRRERRTAAPVSRAGLDLVAPRLIGRRDPIDVMLVNRPTGPGWELLIDPDHPVVFDHPIDHVPGNAAIEAARQAALLALGQPAALPVEGDFSFQHYLEFDSPCLVFAELDGSSATGVSTVRIVLEQDGHTAAEGSFGLRCCG